MPLTNARHPRSLDISRERRAIQRKYAKHKHESFDLYRPKAFRVVFCSALLAGVALPQAGQNPPGGAPYAPAKDSVAEALGRLKRGNFVPADLDLITKTRAVGAIPDLKKQFELAQDLISKGPLASTLVRLGDKDPASWNYLVKGASDAIASDAPSPQRFDSEGKTVPGLSP